MKLPFWYPPILTYHRIAPRPRTDTPSVSPEAFDRQMRTLRGRWQPVSLSEMVGWMEQGLPIPSRAVAVTFDDGTEDSFTQAFPILQRHRIPATLFLIASHLGRPDALNAQQIGRMREGGISFGSHTLDHAYLPSLPVGEARRQIVESKRLLEEIGVRVELLSYPGGGFSEPIVRMVREAGYRAACTTNRGIRRFPVDRWSLRRITMHAGAESRFGIWLRCCGYYGINRRFRSPS